MDIKYNIRFDLNNDSKVVAGIGKVEAAIGGVNKSVGAIPNAFASAMGKVNSSLSTLRLSAVIDQANRVSDGLQSISSEGLALSTSMFDLQAITGVSGQKLQEIEGYARSAAKEFGGNAADNVESYKLILSQLSPAIAGTPAALKEMGNSVATLSKTMGGDSVAATEILTTAMNQYGISTEDPIEASRVMAQMMNVMAAGAKEGSAELPQIKSALEQAGMAASAANVSFEETNAAIQVLDKAGKKGSEGGVALRNTLATLSEGRFLPKDVQKELTAAGVNIGVLADKSLPLAQRLKQLKPIMNDSALVTKLFGKENSNAALALVGGIPEMERLTQTITGTKTAYEQAAIVMESPAEKAKRLQASIDDLKISMFNGTGGALGYVSVLGDVTRDLTNLSPAIGLVGKGLGLLVFAEKRAALWTSVVSGTTAAWTTVQAVFNAVMAANPIIWVVAAVVALGAAIAWVATSTEGWGEAWQHTVNGAKFLWEAFVSHAKLYWDTLVNGIMIGLNFIKAGWYEFQNTVGLGDENGNNAAIAKINSDTEARKRAIVDGAKSTVDLYQKSAAEFSAAVGSVHMKDKNESTSGIRDPKIAGSSAAGAGSGGAKAAGKSTTSAIATGGSKSTYVTINMRNLIEKFTITSNSPQERNEKIRDVVVDELTRALAMGAALGS